MKQKDGEAPGNPEDSETLIYDQSGEGSAPAGADDVRFDYSAFERSIERYRSRTPEPASQRGAADPVQKRRTIDLHAVPKDDAVFDIRKVGSCHIVTIRGQLNESFPGRTIGGRLNGPTLFDLTEVDRVTSFGVRSWLEMLDVARLPFAAFVRASPAIVNQITMMRNFCGSVKIHSLVAPYACPRCGSGFGVPFEAIEDRPILRARNPPKVVCPECRGAAEMDEDPWVYFDLDDHLLDSVDPEVHQVLAHLGDGPRRPPVEKSIVGDVTRVRINGPVSGSSRLQRAFGGLEGKVVLDLRAVSELDFSGLEHLLQRLERLPDEVTRLTIDGAPLDLVQRLIERRPPRVFVNSVVTTVRSLTRPLRRRLVVDLKVNRSALKDRQVPEFDLPWRDDPMELEGHDLVAEALILLPSDGPAGPAPIPPISPPVAPLVAPGPAAAAPPPVSPASYAVSHPSHPGVAPRRVRRPLPRWTAPLVIAVVLFLVASTTTVAVALWVQGEVARMGGLNLSVPSEGWSTTNGLPPPWAELELAESNGAVLVVGRGGAPDLDRALEVARDEASATLLVLLARELRLPFEDEALPPDGPEREEAIGRWRAVSSQLMLTRLQDAARRTEDGGYEVVAQYSVSREELDLLATGYTRQVSFRGLTVAPRAPWIQPGLRLVRRESYIRSVEPGDVLRAVGPTPVATAEEFQAVAEEAYRSLEEGGALPFVFDRRGKEVITTVFKPKTSHEPDPQQVNRPTLFRKDE